MDAQPGKFSREAARRVVERVLRDVDRHVHRGARGADEKPALHALPAAILDELTAAAGEARDGSEVPPRKRELGARHVILGEAADAREQAAARGIVEVLGRKEFLRSRKSRDDVVAKTL
jgi:hypothetical protein